MSDTAKIAWTDWEHQVLRTLRKFEELTRLKGTWVVAFSGGLDSTLLLHTLSRLAPVLEWELRALHAHHGSNPEDPSIARYRDSAADFCEAFCQRRSVPLKIVRYHGKRVLRSEDDFRSFRWQELRQFRGEAKACGIVTAHHANDQIETQMLRLLRGSGLEGLRAMTPWNGEILRPFLSFPLIELAGEVERLGLEFCQDPSNSDLVPLRNWLRHKWLKDLRERDPALLKNLARSLGLLGVERLDPIDIERGIDGSFRRDQFLKLSVSEQRQWLHRWTIDLGLPQYRSTQIEEIRFQLDNQKIVHSFKVGGVLWQMDSEWIRPKIEAKGQ